MRPDKETASSRLAAFVASNPSRRGGSLCKTCLLPADLLEAIREERRKGTFFSILAGFLRAEGHEVNKSMLSEHFQKHEQSA